MRTPSSERPTSIEGCILAAERARIFQLDPNGERLPPEDTPELHRQERFQDLFNALVFTSLGPAFAGKSDLRIALWAVLAYVSFWYWPFSSEIRLRHYRSRKFGTCNMKSGRYARLMSSEACAY
jgi:hypothetical protein